MFADYGYGEIEEFDYGPYEPAMRAASRPGVVDDERPTLQVGEPSISTASDASTSRDGAGDNLAIRTVRWETDDGTTGSRRDDLGTGCRESVGGQQW